MMENEEKMEVKHETFTDMEYRPDMEMHDRYESFSSEILIRNKVKRCLLYFGCSPNRITYMLIAKTITAIPNSISAAMSEVSEYLSTLFLSIHFFFVRLRKKSIWNDMLSVA